MTTEHHRMGLHAWRGFILASTLWGVVGCPGGNTDGTIVDPPAETRTCAAHRDCGEDFLCVGGECKVGQCVATVQDSCRAGTVSDDDAAYCCKPWQICNFDRTCVADPDAAVGSQCEVSADCANVGEFCSGGNCYDASGREPCFATYNCNGDERCDTIVNLCVPDLGGCTYCANFEELCCETGFVCDIETGFCLDVNIDPECTPATEDADCLPNQKCDDIGRCVQCITSDDCGPGTECNTGTGSCYSILNRCETDDDCNAGKRCALASSECVTPVCEEDSDCQGSDVRQRCDVSRFACYLPPASCDEPDEPNNNTIEATTILATGGAGQLCRGDVDFLKFPITGDKRYEVLVAFPDYNIGGMVVALLGPQGTVKDQKTIPNSANKVTLVALSSENDTGEFFIRLTGSSIQADQWAYTITIVEEDAPDIVTCDEEVTLGIEPNDTFANARAVEPGVYVFNRCADSDIDIYAVTVPAQHGVSVTVEHDHAIGDLALKLYKGPTEADKVDESDFATGVETADFHEGPSTFYVKVALSPFDNNSQDGQPYTLNVTTVPRPASCAADTNEPGDDAVGGAGILPVDTTTNAMRCNNYDLDHHAFTLDGNAGGVMRIDFTQSQGDLRLELLNDAGTVIGTSNSSTSANGSEQLEVPFAAAATSYVARVTLAGASGGIAQPYSIVVQTYDAGTCVASEPSSNNTLLDADCVGSLVSELACPGLTYTAPIIPPTLVDCATTPEVAGCATICGVNDQDWYRVGKLNDGQFLRAKVTYDPAIENPGRIGLQLVRGSADNTSVVVVQYNQNTADNAEVELTLNAPTVDPFFAREYAVVVKPEGAGSFTALDYTIEVEVSPPCLPDTREPNANPSETANLRDNTGVFDDEFDGTLCGTDTDVHEFFVFTGETITATLAGPPGVTVDLGSRPEPITASPVTLAGGAGVEVVAPCPVTVGGGVDEPESCTSASVTSASIQQVYATVKRLDAQNPGASVGPYRLTIHIEP